MPAKPCFSTLFQLPGCTLTRLGDMSKEVHIKNKNVIYEDCKANSANSIDDSPENIVIVPETAIDVLQHFRCVKKIIWWLSLDFFFGDNAYFRTKKKIESSRIPACFAPIIYFLFLLMPSNKQNISKDKRYIVIRDSYNMYNCEYVRKFLISNNIQNDRMRYLCGPIDLNYNEFRKNEIVSNKKDLICYSPAKSDKIFMYFLIKELRKRNNAVKIVALENMDHEKLIETLLQAKIYIDFGTFPGPERIPREAVMCYCNTITSTVGSAGNNVDIPIDMKYKLDISILKIDEIADIIITFFKDYNDNIGEYDIYREKVANQIVNFENDAVNNLIYWKM